EEGSLDGYVLYAQIADVEETADGRTVSFVNANPADYLAELDVHTTRDVDLEEALGEDALAQLERAIEAQVSANEELSAQLLISVMSAQETQDELDELYGEGTYSLAALTASISVNTPSIKLTSEDSTVTAGITVSAKVTLKNGSRTVLTVTPALTFEQAVTVKTSVDGGAVWIDMAVTIQTKSTIRLEVTATSGGDSSVLSNAKETLETLISPDGLTDGMDYDESASQLMETMQSLIATQLSYNDLFSVTLLYVQISFYGIVTFSVQLDFVGQIGVLATFGIEIIITNGQRIGFNYNFLKFKGGSFTEKLPGDVTTNIYLIGKAGVRLGLRLTLSLSLCGIAKASITGEIFAYAELTGLYYFTASLISGSSTSVGALYFEVGLDAAVKLSLSVKLIFKTYRKSWTVWSDRWPLYSLSRSSSLTYMDVEKLDTMWNTATDNADKKSSYGFSYIPMKTYNLLDGEFVQNELLWESTKKVSLEVTAVTVNGEEITENDERWEIFYVGDGSEGSTLGRVYANEDLAVEYEVTNASCDIAIRYKDTSTSAFVKYQEHFFHLERKFEIATTTVNVSVALYDWCAHAWGLETASWDKAVVYTTSFETGHILGSATEPTATGDLDLAAAEAAALSMYGELDTATFAWYDPTRNSLYGAVEYSVPKTSNFCYLTPATGTVRYDVRPGTDEYSITFYLYARSYEGYDASIQYIVRLIGETEQSYSFAVNMSSLSKTLWFTKSQTAENEWVLNTWRTYFSGKGNTLWMKVNGGSQKDTGFVITGREVPDTVVFEINLEELESETETETETESELESEAETEAESGTETESESETAPETEPEPVTEPQTERET
ncbi:MAG: hypothetical protein LUG56_01665, partial [Lachnospiraceae bacterium]|nr:hypothetical protein [Lachnospiraceae bacterium]